jgi:hypothetical protein
MAEGGIRGEVRDYGRNANTATASDRLRKLGDGGVGFGSATRRERAAMAFNVTCRRVRRPLALRQSAPADGL